MALSRKGDTSAKKVSRLYVEPAEVARKLIKELESTKAAHGGEVWVRDRYTVFLCREDYNRFRVHVDKLVSKFESHLEGHVHAKRYATAGEISVELTMDPDLKPGYFGVLAEDGGSDYGRAPAAGPGPDSRDRWDSPMEMERPYEEDYAADYPQGGGDPFADGQASAPPLPGTAAPRAAAPPPMPSTPPPPGSQYGGPAAAPPPQEREFGAPPPLMDPSYQQPAPAPPARNVPPAMPATSGLGTMDQGVGLAPAAGGRGPAAGGEQLALVVNGREQVYPQGEVTVGRSRDVDLRVDNPDVSRRHAVIYLSEGSVVVKDLGSTNGTMVNGYPVESTVVRPSDVIRIGDCQITAYPR